MPPAVFIHIGKLICRADQLIEFGSSGAGKEPMANRLENR